ncbi:MAG: bifunctional 4-hydroxy-3-methylbut-2-enyl diphosphate reductase/30S ribosomal protein S1 [Eubacteriaceae bacterium]|nr:bifunctional 4-hydroxy-3-methylbut-2-enyl diphosphate reductase/30S ribosomal protein S1 [Eubacteriaceae bacterium]
MKEIIRAPHSGFCFGVQQAIDKAMRAGGNENKEINTCGMLIHNKMVKNSLLEKGIGLVGSPAEASPGSVIIVRSHGEPKEFYREAEKRNLEVVDATCPFVKRIQQLAGEAHEQGRGIIIVGDKDHPEVVGINGWCGNAAVIFNDEEEAGSFFESHREECSREKFLVVAQTTIRKDVFDRVISVINNNGIDAQIRNTICLATEERQQGAKETAEKADVMLVVGDKTSSNTKKLFEITQKYCKKSFFIENIEDLPLKELAKYNRIGVAAGASTPENAIKEVIANMSDKITENDTMTMEDLMEDIEKSLRLPKGGELVTGKVHQVNDKEIIVNLGCKKDGIIPLDEISLEGDQKLTELYSEGDEIQAKVLKTDDGDGTILLSKKKLEAGEHWEEINKALEEKTLIDVDVVRQVNGGVIATYKEVSGFIPLSQLSDRFVEDSSEFVGQTLTVKVSRVDQRRGKAVFSHKAYLNEERQKALEKVWANIHVDDIVEGTVMRFTDYGAFVDIGGIDGLLHISEISWGKLKHPQEALSIGEKITVKILSMNAEKGKISLGLKQTMPEPWTIIDEKYHVDDVVKGKVVQVKEYGCFVELEPGLDGLVHISEVNHKRVANINDELAVGDEVNAKILEIDKDRKRISLSIKATLDPDAEETAPVEEPAEETAPVEEAAETAEETTEE